jgi:hypothetical protein
MMIPKPIARTPSMVLVHPTPTLLGVWEVVVVRSCWTLPDHRFL